MTKYDDIKYHAQSIADGDFSQVGLENYYASLVVALYGLGYLAPNLVQDEVHRSVLEAEEISPSEVVGIVDGKLDSVMLTRHGNELMSNYDQIAGAYWGAAEDGEFDALNFSSCRSAAQAILAEFASPSLTPFR